MTTNVSARVREITSAKETVTTRAAVASSRMAFIDNLRILLTILVPLLHLAITYGGEGSWFYTERPTTELAGILLTLFVALCQFFFMGLFFLISGYFIPGSVERKGNGKYMKDRLIRLGIPLVLFSLLVSPFLEYVKSVTVYKNNPGSIVSFALDYWKSLDYAPGPLWFVELLLVFTLVYVVGRAILSRGKAAMASNTTMTKASQTAVKKPLTHTGILAFILVLALLNFIIRLGSPIGNEWEHLQLAFFPQYILMFSVGILAYRRNWLPDLPAGVRKVWSVIGVAAIIALPVIMVLGGVTEDTGPISGGITWQSAVLSTWEAVYCVSMSILLLSVFRSRLDRQGTLGRIMSQNAYTVYIIHPLVIIPAAYLVRNVSIDPLLKFILVAPVAVALSFVVSQLLVRRIPMVDKIL